MHGNIKMFPDETVPGMGGEKGEWWWGWIDVWHIWYILRIFVNATLYTQHSRYTKKKKGKKCLKENKWIQQAAGSKGNTYQAVAFLHTTNKQLEINKSATQDTWNWFICQL
jgi:hypothetical protein